MSQIRPILALGCTSERGQLMLYHKTERLLPYPYIRLGLPIDSPSSRVVVFTQLTWQYWRLHDTQLRYSIPDFSESLLLDNLQLGAGVDWQMTTDWRIQPVISLIGQLGIPVRSIYSYQNNNYDRPDLPINQEIEGGVLRAFGWQVQSGIQYELSESMWLNVSYVFGGQYQRFNFVGAVDPTGVLLSGHYNGWSLAWVKQLGKGIRKK